MTSQTDGIEWYLEASTILSQQREEWGFHRWEELVLIPSPAEPCFGAPVGNFSSMKVSFRQATGKAVGPRTASERVEQCLAIANTGIVCVNTSMVP